MPDVVTISLFGYHLDIAMTLDTFWVAFGFAAQAVFAARFLVQWISSERAKRSIVPASFWYFSVLGGVMLLSYAIYRQDPVFILGQTTGLFIYLRNISLLWSEKREKMAAAEDAATQAAEKVSAEINEASPLPNQRPGQFFSRGLQIFLLALLILIAYRLTWLFQLSPPLSGDEAQYWTWSLSPDWGYYSKPPFVAWMIAAFTSLFGTSEPVIRMSAVLAHGGTSLFLFFLARRLFDEKTAIWSGLIYLTLPAVSLSSGLISTDPFLLFFWSAGLYVSWRILSDPKSSLFWWLGLGVLVGVGMLAKYAMLFFVISFVIVTLTDRQWRGVWKKIHPYLSLVVTGLILLPNILWNLDNQLSTFSHTSDNMNLGGQLFRPEKALEFFGSQFGVFGPILFGLLIYLIFKERRQWWQNPVQRFLVLFILPLFLAILAQSFLSRANANWAAPIYLAATLFVVSQTLAHKWKPLLISSLALHGFAMILLYHLHFIVALSPFELTKNSDPYHRLYGWDKMGAQIMELRQQYPDAGLMSGHRMTTANLFYYAKSPDIVKWDRNGRIDDYYEMVSPPPQDPDASYILVTRDPTPKDILRYFNQITSLGPLEVPLYSDYTLRLHAFHISGRRPQPE